MDWLPMYTNDGAALFNMMQGGPWNGQDVLSPGHDFDNFVPELHHAEAAQNQASTTMDANNALSNHSTLVATPSCKAVVSLVEPKLNIHLYPLQNVAS